MTDLGLRIGQALYGKDKTQKQLADYLGVNRHTVTQWLLYGNYPSSRFLPDICKFLGVSADWLLFGDETPLEIKNAKS